MSRPLHVVKANSTMLFLRERDGWTCWYCSRSLPPIGTHIEDIGLSPSIEHLIPKSCRHDPRVGLPTNLRLAHRKCNALAADKPIDEKLSLRAALSTG